MRLSAIPWLVAVVAAGCLQVASHAADVTIKLEGTDRHVTTPAYEAIIAADGSLTSLRIGGTEMLTSNASFPRGLYLFQGGLLKLPNLEATGDNVLTAKSDKGSVRYEFTPEGINCTIANATKDGMEWVLVFEEPVNAVMNAQGRYVKAPLERAWDTTTWFQGKAKLKIIGGTRIWGPWNGNHAMELQPGAERDARGEVRDRHGYGRRGGAGGGGCGEGGGGAQRPGGADVGPEGPRPGAEGVAGGRLHC